MSSQMPVIWPLLLIATERTNHEVKGSGASLIVYSRWTYPGLPRSHRRRIRCPGGWYSITRSPYHFHTSYTAPALGAVLLAGEGGSGQILNPQFDDRGA